MTLHQLGGPPRANSPRAHLSVSRLSVGVVATVLGLGLREAAIGPAIAASSRVLGGAIAAAAPIAGAATCGVCA